MRRFARWLGGKMWKYGAKVNILGVRLYDWGDGSEAHRAAAKRRTPAV